MEKKIYEPNLGKKKEYVPEVKEEKKEVVPKKIITYIIKLKDKEYFVEVKKENAIAEKGIKTEREHYTDLKNILLKAEKIYVEEEGGEKREITGDEKEELGSKINRLYLTNQISSYISIEKIK